MIDSHVYDRHFEEGIVVCAEAFLLVPEVSNLLVPLDPGILMGLGGVALVAVYLDQESMDLLAVDLLRYRQLYRWL